MSGRNRVELYNSRYNFLTAIQNSHKNARVVGSGYPNGAYGSLYLFYALKKSVLNYLIIIPYECLLTREASVVYHVTNLQLYV